MDTLCSFLDTTVNYAFLKYLSEQISWRCRLQYHNEDERGIYGWHGSYQGSSIVSSYFGISSLYVVKVSIPASSGQLHPDMRDRSLAQPVVSLASVRLGLLQELVVPATGIAARLFNCVANLASLRA